MTAYFAWICAAFAVISTLGAAYLFDKSAVERIETVRLGAADANKRTAELTATAEALRAENLELLRKLEQDVVDRIKVVGSLVDRRISPAQVGILVAVLRSTPQIPVSLHFLIDTEPSTYGNEIAAALRNAGANIKSVGRNNIVPAPVGVRVTLNQADPRSVSLFNALKAAGVDPLPVDGEVDAETIRIFVGAKPSLR